MSSQLIQKRIGFRRVLLKISGESLIGEQTFGVDVNVTRAIAEEIKQAHDLGAEVAVVLGGSNIFRGFWNSADNMDRSSADYIGMLATVMNAVALQDALERTGVATRVLSAIAIPQLAEPFIRRRAIRHLEKRRIIIFAAGTGTPFFSTDSAAALRGLEIKAEVLLKATNLDGIYSADPMGDPTATPFEWVTFQEVLEKQWKAMDGSALSLCMDNNLPIVIFNMHKAGNLARVIRSEPGIGTRICRKCPEA